MDYFSQFDWDNYCVSLNGPVRLTSFPDTPRRLYIKLCEICLTVLPGLLSLSSSIFFFFPFSAEPTESEGADLLLSRDFLKKCEDEFASAFRWSDNASNPRLFHRKHLNIVDPLKANNNLGRSVSKGADLHCYGVIWVSFCINFPFLMRSCAGNFYRIRSAFTFGARKLGRILTLPEERAAEELNKFFTNTLDRHDNVERSDTQCVSSASSNGGPSASGELDAISLECGVVQRNPKRDAEDPAASSSAPLDFRGGLFEDIVKLRISELGGDHLPRSEDNSAEDHSISGISRTGEPRSDVGGSEAPEDEAAGSAPRGEPSEGSEAAALSVEGFEPSDLSDLTGDYNCYMRNLLCAVGCLERQPPSYPFYSSQGRDAPQQVSLFPHMGAGGIVARPFSPAGYYPLGAAAFIPSAYGLEDVPRTRGTGTYFPNVVRKNTGDSPFLFFFSL